MAQEKQMPPFREPGLMYNRLWRWAWTTSCIFDTWYWSLVFFCTALHYSIKKWERRCCFL